MDVEVWALGRFSFTEEEGWRWGEFLISALAKTELE